MSIRRKLVFGALLLSACTDVGPPFGPGTFTATLNSPNGDEGAAVVLLIGEGVLGVTAVGDTEAHAVSSGEATRIVLINQWGGTLSFTLAVTDLSQPPVWLIREVAGPDDELRSDLSEYRVGFSVEGGG